MGEIKYANSVEIQSQTFDMQLTFSLNSQGETIDTTTIILSPQHFKTLAYMLTMAVEEYEKKVGKIELPTKSNVETNGGE